MNNLAAIIEEAFMLKCKSFHLLPEIELLNSRDFNYRTGIKLTYFLGLPEHDFNFKTNDPKAVSPGW